MNDTSSTGTLNSPKNLQMWSAAAFAACFLVSIFMLTTQLAAPTPSESFEVSAFEVILDQGMKIAVIITALVNAFVNFRLMSIFGGRGK